MSVKKYNNLDGIRAYACIAIVLMHVLDNGKYGLSGFIFESFIFSFTNFTFLFMLISAFSLCCGYYKKFKENSISLESFYKRRYQRIWPFFAVLCTLELMVDHSLTSFYEWIADLSLMFGFIPNNRINVVGVGWFLGTIFVFYMVFPFFVFAMGNKKRAWLVMGTSIILHILCCVYFKETGGRRNFLYSSMFFVAGGLIYLYKDKLEKIKTATIILLPISLVGFYTVNDSDITTLVVFVLMAIMCITYENVVTKVVFQNRVISFLGSISMEIYLCHMFVFRILEKIGLSHLTGNELTNYALISIATLCGAFLVAFAFRQVFKMVSSKTVKL